MKRVRGASLTEYVVVLFIVLIALGAIRLLGKTIHEFLLGSGM